MYDGTEWIGKDFKEAKVVFPIEKHLKSKFLDTLQQDANENFFNVKR